MFDRRLQSVIATSRQLQVQHGGQLNLTYEWCTSVCAPHPDEEYEWTVERNPHLDYKVRVFIMWRSRRSAFAWLRPFARRAQHPGLFISVMRFRQPRPRDQSISTVVQDKVQNRARLEDRAHRILLVSTALPQCYKEWHIQ